MSLVRSAPHKPVAPHRPLRVESLEERRMLSADAASAAVNQFAWDVYDHMQREDGNLFFSPLSISTGLAMTSLGAAGQTLAEMQQVLHLGADPAIHDSYRDLFLSSLVRSAYGPDYEFAISNAIWPQVGNPIEQAFIDAVQNKYFGHVENVDFADPQAAEDTINAWIADQTEGKIDDLVSNLSPLTAMVLTNTVYFASPWAAGLFGGADIEGHEFRLSNGEVAPATMMAGQPIGARTQINGFDVLELPFESFNYPNNPPFNVGPEYPTASMVLVMPLEASTPNVLSEETLLAIDQWLDSSPSKEKLEVILPRFETTVETNLNAFLADLGMPAAFDPGLADFSGAFGAQGHFIDQVLHKATIKVTEEGVEAAAATEVELFLCFAGGTPVLTPDGARSIEQLQVGDFVLARDEHNLEADPEPKVIEETRQGNAAVLEVTVNGRVIRTTDLHPFFVRGHGWTPAGKLRVGDKLYTSGVDWVEVQCVTETGKAVPVFNLRVADHHTYFVGGDDWGFAVWTHNFYGDGFYADRPFHFMIYDNDTDVVAFMGRIDDPTQSDNSVTPVVQTTVPLPGDYNGDGAVDAADYDVWLAAYGATGVGLAADGNGDGVVNAADYTVWRDHEGTTAPALSATQEDALAASEQDADLTPALLVDPTSPQRSSTRSVRPALREAIGSASDRDLLLLAGAAARARSVREAVATPTKSDSASEAVDSGFEAWGVEQARQVRAAFGPTTRGRW